MKDETRDTGLGGVEEVEEAGGGFWGGFGGEGVFPDSGDAVAVGAEVGGDFFVSGLVVAEFFGPEGAI